MAEEESSQHYFSYVLAYRHCLCCLPVFCVSSSWWHGFVSDLWWSSSQIIFTCFVCVFHSYSFCWLCFLLWFLYIFVILFVFLLLLMLLFQCRYNQINAVWFTKTNIHIIFIEPFVHWKPLNGYYDIQCHHWPIYEVHLYLESLTCDPLMHKWMIPGSLYRTRPRGYKTLVYSKTQNKAQWLAACGHVRTRVRKQPIIALCFGSENASPQAANHCALYWVWDCTQVL